MSLEFDCAAADLALMNNIIFDVGARLDEIKGDKDAILIEMAARLLGRNLTVKPPPYVLEDMLLSVLKWCAARNLPEVL